MSKLIMKKSDFNMFRKNFMGLKPYIHKLYIFVLQKPKTLTHNNNKKHLPIDTLIKFIYIIQD